MDRILRENKGVIGVFLVAVAVAVYLTRNITNPVLGYDSSGQVFTALGIPLYSAPFTRPGTLLDAYRLNLGANLDPGGFTFLLRYWALTSTNWIWLRILPLLFLLGTIGVFFRFARKCGLKPYLSCLLALLPLTSLVIAEWGLMIRAYSMEMLGATLAGYFCYFEGRTRDGEIAAPALLTLAAFATSRYCFLIVVLAFLASWVIVNHKRLVLSRATLLWVLPFVLVLTPFRHHAQNIPRYFHPFVLQGKSVPEILATIGQNLRRVETFFQFFFFLAYAFLGTYSLKYEQHRRFFWMLIFVNTGFILASSMGLAPWYLGDRFSISLNILSFFALICGFDIFMDRYPQKPDLRPTAFLGVSGVICLAIATFRFDPYTNILEAFRFADSQKWTREKGLYSFGAYSDARYLFEYGVLKKNPAYPSRIVQAPSGKPIDPWAAGGKGEIGYVMVLATDLSSYENRPGFTPVDLRLPYLRLFKAAPGR